MKTTLNNNPVTTEFKNLADLLGLTVKEAVCMGFEVVELRAMTTRTPIDFI